MDEPVKSTSIRGVIVLLAASLCAICAYAAGPTGVISIKEFHLGMDRDEVLKLDDLFCDSKFDATLCYTVGGRVITNRHFVYDHDDKLVSLTFEFAAADFDAIKQAIIAKYPKLQCSEKNVENRMGAVFLNDRCLYETKSDSMVVARYADSLDFGMLRIVSNKLIDALHKSEREERKDI